MSKNVVYLRTSYAFLLCLIIASVMIMGAKHFHSTMDIAVSVCEERSRYSPNFVVSIAEDYLEERYLIDRQLDILELRAMKFGHMNRPQKIAQQIQNAYLLQGQNLNLFWVRMAPYLAMMSRYCDNASFLEHHSCGGGGARECRFVKELEPFIEEQNIGLLIFQNETGYFLKYSDWTPIIQQSRSESLTKIVKSYVRDQDVHEMYSGF